MLNIAMDALIIVIDIIHVHVDNDFTYGLAPTNHNVLLLVVVYHISDEPLFLTQIEILVIEQTHLFLVVVRSAFIVRKFAHEKIQGVSIVKMFELFDHERETWFFAFGVHFQFQYACVRSSVELIGIVLERVNVIA